MAECILIKSGQVPDEYRGGVFRPTQTDQIIIPNEGMALGDVIIQGEPNFAAENIRYGVSMWGGRLGLAMNISLLKGIGYSERII